MIEITPSSLGPSNAVRRLVYHGFILEFEAGTSRERVKKKKNRLSESFLFFSISHDFAVSSLKDENSIISVT